MVKIKQKEDILWLLYIAHVVYICSNAAVFGTAVAEQAIFITKPLTLIGANAAFIIANDDPKTIAIISHNCYGPHEIS